jgi:ParB family chromosome partitioning protein
MTQENNQFPQDELKVVRLENIQVNPFQPRTIFSESELQELAESIKSVGIIHPPVVRLTDDKNIYEIISGERRYRASKLAGLKEIPVVVRHANNVLSAQAALIENIQRVDLNPLEISKALKSLMREFNLNQDELSLKVGKKRSTVSNYLRLLSLPKRIQDSLEQDEITMGHAKAILSLEGFEKQIYLFELVVRDSLSVRETEQTAQNLSQKEKKKPLVYATRDFYLEQLAEKIQYKLGTKVSIQGKGRRGRISIDYFNLDDLDRLLAIFGIQQ